MRRAGASAPSVPRAVIAGLPGLPTSRVVSGDRQDTGHGAGGWSVWSTPIPRWPVSITPARSSWRAGGGVVKAGTDSSPHDHTPLALGVGARGNRSPGSTHQRGRGCLGHVKPVTAGLPAPASERRADRRRRRRHTRPVAHQPPSLTGCSFRRHRAATQPKRRRRPPKRPTATKTTATSHVRILGAATAHRQSTREFFRGN